MAENLNDVNVPKMRELDQVVRQNPSLARATMKASSTWHRGTKAVIEVGRMDAGGQNFFPPTRKFVMVTDDPDLLGGVDSAPTPAETLVAALAGCLTSGIAANAALFGVPLDQIGIELEADLDFRGVLGHDKSVRSGFSDIRYTVTIQSPAPEDKVRKCKETIDRKSPVRDTIANPVNITSKFVYKPR
ncbi:MAG: OsmC family protein [Candidatus Rokuibacteriota bacterium]